MATDTHASAVNERAAFHEMVAPHLDELLKDATREIRYRERLGDLPRGDVTPEELVGETILRAWRSRRQRPAGLSTKAWLLGTQHRVLMKLMEVEYLERELWALSLEDPLPPEPLFDDDESFWEWYQPDDFTRWEDVIPADGRWDDASYIPPEDVSYRLDPNVREVLLLHGEHALSVAEIAYATRRSLRETKMLLDHARGMVRR